MVADSKLVPVTCPLGQEGSSSGGHVVTVTCPSGQGRAEGSDRRGHVVPLACSSDQGLGEGSDNRGHVVTVTCPSGQGLGEGSDNRGHVVPLMCPLSGQEGSASRCHTAPVTCMQVQGLASGSASRGHTESLTFLPGHGTTERSAPVDSSYENPDRDTPQTGPTVDGSGRISERDPPGLCAGCGLRIAERYYLLAVDRKWHIQCLTCSDCHFRLDSQVTCFARDGHIYCKEDYYRRFAHKTCAGCQGGISANQLVMRARDHLFHLSCFSCSTCRRLLVPGEQFAFRDHLLFCRTHFEHFLQRQSSTRMPPHSAAAIGYSGLVANSNGSVSSWRRDPSGTPKWRARKRKDSILSEDGCANFGIDATKHPGGETDREGCSSQQGTGRQKRVRTSFKQHQLRTMRTYFSVNHNPDAKDLRQLALRTGLTKRVLQVWFQNARAKYRRSLAKQQAPEDSHRTSRTSTVAAAAASPSRAGDSSDAGHSSMTDRFLFSRSPAALSDISSTTSVCGESLLGGVSDCIGEQLSSAADLWLL